MDKQICFQEEVSEYISCEKLDKFLMDSSDNLSKMVNDISIINRSEDNQLNLSKLKNKIQQLSKYSQSLNNTLLNMSFSFNDNEEEIEEEREQEEHKENVELTKLQISEIRFPQDEARSQNKIKLQESNSQRRDDQAQHLSEQSQKLSANRSKMNIQEHNFYKDLNDIQFSRELDYFYKGNGKEGSKSEIKVVAIKDQEEEKYNDGDVDTLGMTFYLQSAINDEIYQKRQSEKKSSSHLEEQEQEEEDQEKQQDCSSFVDDKLSHYINNIPTSAKNNLERQKDQQEDGQKKIAQEEVNQNNNDQLQQQQETNYDFNERDDEIYIQKYQREANSDLRQNIEGENNSQLRQDNSHLKQANQNKQNNSFRQILLISIIVLILANLAINFLDKQDTIQKFISIKYNQIFRENQDNKLREQLADNLKLQQQISNYQNEIGLIKNLSSIKQEEFKQETTNLMETISKLTNQVNYLKTEQQNQNLQLGKLTKQMQQQIQELKRCSDVEELYNNLKQVFELYKISEL